MGRSKKKPNNESSSTLLNQPPGFALNLQFDIEAVRGKNSELVQSVAKLQQEKCLLQKQINILQKDYFSLNSKYANLKNVFSTVDSTIKVCFPKVAEVVQQLAKVMHCCSVASMINKPDREQITHAVSPHTVNGTVIKNPTITLARFSNIDNSNSSLTTTSPRLSKDRVLSPTRTSTSTVEGQDARPSTSRGTTNGVAEDDNEEIFVQRRKNAAPLDSSSEDDEGENQNENNLEDVAEEAEQEENLEGYGSRLVTITEEQEEEDKEYSNLNSSNSQYTDRIQEIRIYLSPLRDEKSSPDKAISSRTSSLSGEPSNTLIESPILNESVNTSVKFLEDCTEKTLFRLENSEFWKNNKTDSFSFSANISGISKSPNEPSCSTSLSLTDISKIATMESLGLSATINRKLASSTPVIKSPRTSSRLSIKNQSTRTTKSNITKRKTSGEKNVAQVLIKRLNLDKSKSPSETLSELLDETAMVSPKQIKKKSKSIKSKSNDKPSGSSSNTPTVPELKKNQKAKNKGKENIKVQQSLQITKLSPRPKRAARPTALREPSLNKKMRRSK